jgi:uncharacterized protein YecE (DUF72 family)
MGIAVGTASWTDPTLIKDAGFYPSASMSAEDRLKYYASIFTMVEVDATYYGPPAERVSELWVERTPPHFRFDIKSYALFTQHPAEARSLWRDVAADLPPEHRDKKRVYLNHLPPEAVDRAWDHFRTSLEPLQRAGKLGAVMMQFPPWFTAKKANREYLREVGDRMAGMPVAVEFRHGSWMGEDDRDRTLSLLEQLGLAYVCVDEPQGFKTSVPPVVAATADLAVVRFHGHNAETWNAKGITAAERFEYLYSVDELREWVEPIRELASSAAETHAVMNNCYRDYGVRNARQLADLLGEGLQHGAPTERLDAADLADRTKAELLDEARRRDIPGRSSMTKTELARAIVEDDR